MAKVLVIEDDRDVSEAVLDSLEQLNLTVELVENGIEGAERLKIYHYDLAIVDLTLPGKLGTDICREYRAHGGMIPILMLTGRTSTDDVVKGFDCGADDYVTKPFSLKELNARVKALLRRPVESVAEILKIGGLTYNLKTNQVKKEGKELTIMPKELALLEFFMRHPGQTFSVNELLNRVWSSESDSSDEAVWQAITRLRKRIDDNQQASYIVTVKRLGYRMCDPGSNSKIISVAPKEI